MATLKGSIRSFNATVRKIERENQRRAREAAKRFKAQQKQLELENAKQAVKDWGNYVETLLSLHKTCSETINWKEIESLEKPDIPQNIKKYEKEAQNILNGYKPNFFDKWIGRDKKKILRLEKAVELAIKKDEKVHESVLEEYSSELNDWQELQDISSGVRNKELEYYRMAVDYFNPFSEINELGSRIRIDFNENLLTVDLNVNGSEVVPDYELRQTSTGKLSKKNMSKSRFNELYQDHVCSSLIRIAREVFAHLPIESVRVNALTDMVNSSNGHLEEQPIISVIFMEKTLKGLNLEMIDPSDSLTNFVHNMSFNKTSGFKPVKRVEFV